MKVKHVSQRLFRLDAPVSPKAVEATKFAAVVTTKKHREPVVKKPTGVFQHLQAAIWADWAK